MRALNRRIAKIEAGAGLSEGQLRAKALGWATCLLTLDALDEPGPTIEEIEAFADRILESGTAAWTLEQRCKYLDRLHEEEAASGASGPT
jgi:hypothetical protein